MPIISAVGRFCCDKFEETPNEKVVKMSKLTKSYFKIIIYFYRYVELPDGRLQRVRYRVDKYSGFVADVTYEHGKAPAPKYEPVPDYMPAHLPDDGPSKFNPFG